MSEQNPWDFSEFSESSGSSGPTGSGGQQQQPGGPFQPQGTEAPGQAPGEPGQQPGGFGMAPSGAAPFETATLDSGGSPTTMTSAFGGAPEPPQQLATAAPPVLWLAVSALLAVVGLVLALVLGGLPPVAIGAWALAGPVGIGMLALFTTKDLRARAGAVYLAQAWVRPLYWICVVLCLVGAMVAAWKIAEWVGRL